jgi:hypothetical protein
MTRLGMHTYRGAGQRYWQTQGNIVLQSTAAHAIACLREHECLVYQGKACYVVTAAFLCVRMRK